MRPLRILESCLYAEDLVAAEDFYLRVLGLQLFLREEGRHVFFRMGDSMLLIFDAADGASRDSLPAHGQRGAGHLAFAADESELELWRVRLESEGVRIELVHDWPQGGRSIYFRDPAGNSLEIASRRIWGI